MKRCLFLFLIIVNFSFARHHDKINETEIHKADSIIMKQFMGQSDSDLKHMLFKKVNDVSLKIYYKKPFGLKKTENCPAIVFIHGGGWTSGSADVFFPHVRYFAYRRMVAFSIEYRLMTPNGTSVTDCIADCKSAIRYIRTHAQELNVDVNKIVVCGDSAGGHLAACLGVIDGFDDLADDKNVNFKANVMILFNPGLDLTVPSWVKIPIGGAAIEKNATLQQQIPTKQQLELAKKVSPIFNIHKGVPPTLLMHGLDDKVILPEQSIRFNEIMKQAGNRCELILLPATRHAFVMTNYTATEYSVVSAICAADRFLGSLHYINGSPILKASAENPAWTPKIVKH